MCFLTFLNIVDTGLAKNSCLGLRIYLSKWRYWALSTHHWFYSVNRKALLLSEMFIPMFWDLSDHQVNSVFLLVHYSMMNHNYPFSTCGNPKKQVRVWLSNIDCRSIFWPLVHPASTRHKHVVFTKLKFKPTQPILVSLY